MGTIIDNLGENTLDRMLVKMRKDADKWDLATAYFSLEGLRLVGEALKDAREVRLLFGEDANHLDRARIMALMQSRSADDLRAARADDPLLAGLAPVERLFAEGRFQARVYRRNPHNPDAKGAFHAKVFIAHRSDELEPVKAVVGSGNLSKNGLTRNIELGLLTNADQGPPLADWFEARWNEAVDDDVTKAVHDEIARHLDLYPPRALFLRALLEWGEWVRGTKTVPPGRVAKLLDPHQITAVLEGRRILDREGALMVCDGVGLGKSFVALALMEEALANGDKVLLVAPKAIMDASWNAYVERYLPDHATGFASLQRLAMPDFQYAARMDDGDEDAYKAKLRERGQEDMWRRRDAALRELETFAEQVDLVVVDESHNFRSSGAGRYKNLLALLARARVRRGGRTVLMTATPINTRHEDAVQQFRLLCNTTGTVDRDDRSSVAGVGLAMVRAEAQKLDRARLVAEPITFQVTAPEAGEDLVPKIHEVLSRVALQRSRATCAAQALAAGKTLRFPERRGPAVVHYELGPLYGSMVEETRHKFEKLARVIEKYKAAIEEARAKGKENVDRRKIVLPNDGLRFSGYLLDLYLRPEVAARETDGNFQSANREAFLASLVLTNVMKQLESSPAAFLSILRSLGASLAARLVAVAPGDPTALAFVAEYGRWIDGSVRADLRIDAEPEKGDGEDDYAVLPETDADGQLVDPFATAGEDEEAPFPERERRPGDPAWHAWVDERFPSGGRIARLLHSRALAHSLKGFDEKTHDVARWRGHIESDLRLLKALHAEALKAVGDEDDLKLEAVVVRIEETLSAGGRALVFTQSTRTAEYLQDRLGERLPGREVARIDGNVQGRARAELLHRFAPLYNPPAPNQRGKDAPLDVLVSTDVLAEGVNLQEAALLLNYDLHWNPTRLIQRIGRVDRRLHASDLRENPGFQILNVFPPKEIEEVVNLVRVLDRRLGAIHNVTGIDQAFFRHEGEGGTLRELNAVLDGVVDRRQELLALFESLRKEPPDVRELDAEERALAKKVPDGAFGVWAGSGHTGAFGLFRLAFRPDTPDKERRAHADLEGRPVLVLRRDRRLTRDPVEILHFLAATVPGQRSALPPPPEAAARRMLADLHEEAIESLPDNASQYVVAHTVVWMELRT